MDDITEAATTGEVEEGDFKTRKIQSNGRVDVPDEYWDKLDLEEGGEVVVVLREDGIEIREKTLDTLSL